MPKRADETDKLRSRIADAHHQLEGLADRIGWAHSLAYAPSGQRHDTAGARQRAESAPPRAPDLPWARAYYRAASALCCADYDLAEALIRCGTRRLPLHTSHLRGRRPAERPSPEAILQVIRHAAASLAQIPVPPPTRAARSSLDSALSAIAAAHQALPDTRNPVRPRICSDPHDVDCTNLLGPSGRKTVCGTCRNATTRGGRRRGGKRRAA